MLLARKRFLLASLLADENVDFRIIKILRESGIVIHSILEDHKSVSDFEVIEIARKLNSIILTLDKDFGEWVFSHKEFTIGVILLRYNPKEYLEITKAIQTLINQHNDDLVGKFVVLSTSKIRIREIHL